MDALSGLYNRLVILAEELQSIDLLFRLADEKEAATIYPGIADPSQLRRTQDVPVVTAQVREHQTRRLSLPPLPKFPAEIQVEQIQTKVAMQWSQEGPQPQTPTQMSPTLQGDKQPFAAFQGGSTSIMKFASSSAETRRSLKARIAYPKANEPEIYKGRKPSFSREQFEAVTSLLEGGTESISAIANATGISADKASIGSRTTGRGWKQL